MEQLICNLNFALNSELSFPNVTFPKCYPSTYLTHAHVHTCAHTHTYIKVLLKTHTEKAVFAILKSW